MLRAVDHFNRDVYLLLTRLITFFILGLRILNFVILNLVLNILVLLEEQPEHFVELFPSLKRDFKVVFHSLQLFLQHLDALDVSQLKLGLVCCQVLACHVNVLLKFVVECLPRNLDADAQYN